MDGSLGVDILRYVHLVRNFEAVPMHCEWKNQEREKEQRKTCLAANRCPPNENPNTHSLKSEARRSTASRPPVSRVPLHSHDHIIMPAQLHPQLGPLIKVLLRRHSASNPLVLADRPVLLERACALDRRLVDACAGEDLVRALVKREVALGRPRLVGRQVGV